MDVGTTAQAAQTVSKDRSFHPVRQYLNAVAWDGVERLDTWLTTYLGVEDSNYARAVGARWLISAVARIYRPGVKADCCLILEGPQGSKKSTALKTLAGPYFTDELADLGTKDSVLQTQGVWIIELSELDSLSRAEVGRIKAFKSRTTDRFRPPYGKRLTESKYFLDTSALAKLYHSEVGSEYMDRILKEMGSQFVVSRLSIVEMESGLATKVRTGRSIKLVLTSGDAACAPTWCGDD